MSKLTITRTKAALGHLLLSVLIFSIVIAVLIFIWYPVPHFTASGGWQGLKIAAGVDLVLGPLLTLIIFDSAKSRKKLMGDLMVIALLQFTALAWGVGTIYSQRPVALVFWEQSFISVPAAEFDKQKIDIDDLNDFGSEKPVLIYAEKPRELGALKAMLKRITEDVVAPHNQLELYRPLQDYFDEIIPLQLNIDHIMEHNTDIKAKLNKILVKTNKDQNDYFYFSLRSKYQNIILLFDHNGELKNHIVVVLR
ncbi:MAG: hypothetical protein COA95_07105 [Methylophaga sp.]|nr:MAG: hypothetical protein COA95_07105 [Methylophaga sp.]